VNKYECVVLCVVSISLAIVLSVMAFVIPLTRSVDKLTETLSQPGVTDIVRMDSMTITDPNTGATVELVRPDVTVNSRLLDVFLGIMASESGR